jgi:hypothetical protein
MINEKLFRYRFACRVIKAAIRPLELEVDAASENMRWTSCGISDVAEKSPKDPSGDRFRTAKDSGVPPEVEANAT